MLFRYGLAGLRVAALKVVIATLDLDNVCHSVLLAHDHKCSELSQVCLHPAGGLGMRSASQVQFHSGMMWPHHAAVLLFALLHSEALQGICTKHLG